MFALSSKEQALARWWFSHPDRAGRLELLGLGSCIVFVLAADCLLCLPFASQITQAQGPLELALIVSMLACLGGLVLLSWKACSWLCADAFETNAEAVRLLDQAGIPASVDWHLSEAEQEWVARLWSPQRQRERQFRL